MKHLWYKSYDYLHANLKLIMLEDDGFLIWFLCLLFNFRFMISLQQAISLKVYYEIVYFFLTGDQCFQQFPVRRSRAYNGAKSFVKISYFVSINSRSSSSYHFSNRLIFNSSFSGFQKFGEWITWSFGFNKLVKCEVI